MKFKSWIFPLLFFPVFFLLTNFSSSSPPKQPVHAKLLYEESSVKPGRPFSVGIHITLEPGWHIYWKNPGDAGMAPEITWDLPEGFTAAPIIWPAPQKFTTMEMIGYGYEEETIFLTEITPPFHLF